MPDPLCLWWLLLLSSLIFLGSLEWRVGTLRENPFSKQGWVQVFLSLAGADLADELQALLSGHVALGSITCVTSGRHVESILSFCYYK